jgi:hypothetical protein
MPEEVPERAGRVPEPRSESKTPVPIFLVTGSKLQGIITWFDNFLGAARGTGTRSSSTSTHQHRDAGRAHHAVRPHAAGTAATAAAGAAVRETTLTINREAAAVREE